METLYFAPMKGIYFTGRPSNVTLVNIIVLCDV